RTQRPPVVLGIAPPHIDGHDPAVLVVAPDAHPELGSARDLDFDLVRDEQAAVRDGARRRRAELDLRKLAEWILNRRGAEDVTPCRYFLARLAVHVKARHHELEAAHVVARPHGHARHGLTVAGLRPIWHETTSRDLA